MIAPKGIAHTPEQFIIKSILEQAEEASPIGDGVEIERKYVFYQGSDQECERRSPAIEADVRDFFVNRKLDGVVRFEGIDYYFNVKKGDKMIPFRYRFGKPVHHRLGVKVKEDADAVVRKENEFQVREDMETEKVLSFLRVVGSLGDSYREMHVRGRGDIRNEKLRGGKKVEIVVYIVTDILTGKAALVAEIEAHRFASEAAAKRKILEYERSLGWKEFRTSKSVSELLD